MRGKIKILDENVANTIAAGEVVENPAALVKELIENSLDANSGFIKIKVEKGGRNIKIEDNGEGMNKEDLFLCTERHATSKIIKKEDIFNLRTYGFRGEALASIAAVSKLSISSKTEMDAGNKIDIFGGVIKNITEVSRNMGTDMEIKDLFYNTPARLKFLNAAPTEYTKIKEIVLKEALVNYKVSFYLEIEGKEVLFTSGRDIENTILEIFGKNILKNLIKCQYGYAGNMDILKNNKNYIYTYFNKRYAKSVIVEKAILDAYYTKLMKGKYPFFILFYEINPSEMDVNIHPSKKIVKFSNEKNIYTDIKKSIENIFEDNEKKIMPVIDFLKTENVELKYTGKENKIDFIEEISLGKKQEFFKIEEKEKKIGLDAINEENEIINTREEKEIFFESNANNKTEKKHIEEKIEKYEDLTINENLTDNEYNRAKEEENMGKITEQKKEIEKEQIKIIGQLKNTYILVENGMELEIYDQHIVHERILYEELKEKYMKKKIISQTLLVPINIFVD